LRDCISEKCGKRLKNRSRIQIMTMILSAADGGASMSRIMYDVYLSSRPLKRYIEFLQQKGLLRRDERTRLYHVTSLGLEFVSKARLVAEIDEPDSARRGEERRNPVTPAIEAKAE
jgi:predicted transcriptional regulator